MTHNMKGRHNTYLARFVDFYLMTFHFASLLLERNVKNIQKWISSLRLVSCVDTDLDGAHICGIEKVIDRKTQSANSGVKVKIIVNQFQFC